jgi:hypothetical protein
MFLVKTLKWQTILVSGMYVAFPIYWRNWWCKPKALTCFSWKLQVKLPKTGMVLGWVTFLTLDFPVHPTTMAYSILVGIQVNKYFQPTMWEPRGLHLGRWV